MNENEIKFEIEYRINDNDLTMSYNDLIDIANSFDIDEEKVVFLYNQIIDEKREEIRENTKEIIQYFKDKSNFYPSFQEFKKEFEEFDINVSDSVLRPIFREEIYDENQLSLFERYKKNVSKLIKEEKNNNIEDVVEKMIKLNEMIDDDFLSSFDSEEFDNEAMAAAMADIGKDFIPLGKSEFEKNLNTDEFKKDLERMNLNLPSDEKEISSIEAMMKKRREQESRFGKGSLNENLLKILDAEGNEIKRNSLVNSIEIPQKKGRVMGFGDNGKGELELIVNWQWPIDMNITNPEEMGKKRESTKNVVLSKNKKENMENLNETKAEETVNKFKRLKSMIPGENLGELILFKMEDSLANLILDDIARDYGINLNENFIDEIRGVGHGIKRSGDRNIKMRDDKAHAPLTKLNEGEEVVDGKVKVYNAIMDFHNIGGEKFQVLSIVDNIFGKELSESINLEIKSFVSKEKITKKELRDFINEQAKNIANQILK